MRAPAGTWSFARLRLARIGTNATFALAGLVAAVGAVRIPALTDAQHLGPERLGFALLCIGIGAAAASTCARVLLGRHGSRRVLLVVAPATAVLAAAPGFAPGYPWLLAAFLAYGAAFGLLDSAMNAQAAFLEAVTGRHLMNGAHAGWSIGAVCGGGLGALTAHAGLSYAYALLLTAGCATPLALVLTRTYLGDRGDGRRQRRAGRVPPVVYLVGAVTLGSYLIEGAVSSWSGLYLRNDLGAVETVAALGYPCLELAMIVGRGLGDRLRGRVGSRLMLTVSGLVAAGGAGLVVMAGGWAQALGGFFVIGIGVSTVVPLTFSIAGVLAPSGAGIAQAAAMGYAGMLVGPVLLGFVAQGSSMRTTFLVVGGLCLAMSLAGRALPDGGGGVGRALPDGGEGAGRALPDGDGVASG